MKIKDSLDLGGNLLQNFCIDNYSDIDNANRGKGRTIFYTGSDVERKDHVIVFDGTSFKALAYMEDVADNAAFKALQDDVALLKGDVDTDAIISNMKEVSAFLSGFAEDANLMSVLNGKLDKAGGTMTGNIIMGTNAIVFSTTQSSDWANPRNSGLRILNSVGIAGANAPSAYGVGLSVSGVYGFQLALAHSSNGFDFKMRSTRNGTDTPYDWVSLLHEGNYSDYALPLSGGTLTGSLAVSSGTISSLRTSTRRAVFYKNASESVDSGTYIVDVSDSGDAVLKLTYNDLTWKGNTVLTSAGGTIEGTSIQPLLIKSGNESSSAIKFITSDNSSITFGYKKGSGLFCTNENGWSQENTLLHSGNIADYEAQILHGGDLADGSQALLKNAISAWNTSSVNFKENYGLSLSISNHPSATSGSRWRSRLDFGTSGKIYYWSAVNNNTMTYRGELAFTDSTVAAANKLVDASGNDAVLITSNGSANLGLNSDGRGYILYNSANYGVIGEATGGSPRVVLSGWGGVNLRTGGKDALIVNTSGNVLIGTTDDKGANSSLFVAGNSANLITIKRTHDYYGAYIEYIAANADVKQWRVGVNESKCFVFENYNTGNNAVYAMLINSSGNVTIGNKDYASSDYKLFVPGNSVFVDSSRRGCSADKISSSAVVEITAMNKGDNGLYIGQLVNSTVWLQSAYGGSDTKPSSNHTNPLSLQPLGGNVGIGTTNPTSKLHVVGDLYVTGNIVADGEVSAGGASEEGGSSSGGGGGAFYSCTIPVGTTSINVVHGLETEDIVVSLYEKNATNGKWNMAYTDIEIEDANTIEVSFGFATDVDHKVVIMGAQA